jgi:hypothetical protein
VQCGFKEQLSTYHKKAKFDQLINNVTNFSFELMKLKGAKRGRRGGEMPHIPSSLYCSSYVEM